MYVRQNSKMYRFDMKKICAKVALNLQDFCRETNVAHSHPVAAQFERIWRRDGRGLVVIFDDGKLQHFCPFVNKAYENQWHQKVVVEDGLTPSQIVARCAEAAGLEFRSELVLPNLRNWRRNGHLIRGDKNLPRHMHDIEPWLRGLSNIPSGRHIMFINTQDFPRRDCFNMCDSMAENLIPTWDDMRTAPTPHGIDWEARQACAIWRGSNTGVEGLRERLVQMSDGATLDAQFSKWQHRLILAAGKTITFKRPLAGVTLAPFLTLQEQAARAKYCICIDGNVGAFRLGHLLAAEFVVLRVETEWQLWYTARLVAWEHYVPVRRDLGDLHERIEWLRQNDEAARKIAANGRRFFEEHLSPTKVEEWFVRQLIKCRQ